MPNKPFFYDICQLSWTIFFSICIYTKRECRVGVGTLNELGETMHDTRGHDACLVKRAQSQSVERDSTLE